MNKTKKRNGNESCMSDFLISLFSTVLADLGADSSAGKSGSLKLDKRDRHLHR